MDKWALCIQVCHNPVIGCRVDSATGQRLRGIARSRRSGDTSYDVCMTIDQRDRAIVQFVARFGQATFAQIFAIVFRDFSSRTSCDRAVNRLLDGRYLARVERRAVGGQRGGSGQFVYQLGRAGHDIYKPQGSRYIPQRVVNYHSLTIVDVFSQIIEAARNKAFDVMGYMTEPDCWVTIQRFELKPDLYVELRRPTGEAVKFWFEIDMGTQSHGQVRAKFERYWNVWESNTSLWPRLMTGSEGEPVFPLVIFVGVDDERAMELRWLMKQGPDAAQPLYRITTPEQLIDSLL